MDIEPFHQAIIDVVDNTSYDYMKPMDGIYAGKKLSALAEITMRTSIPENHDAIIACFRKKAAENCWWKMPRALIKHIESERRKYTV